MRREDALDFGTVASAAREVVGSQLSDMEIIVWYTQVMTEVRLPMLAEWCRLDEPARRPVGSSMRT